MTRRAFTLIELTVAMLLSSLVVLMIAGTLGATARAWERVQERIGENYSRRTALDLLRRQASSIYYKRDAERLARSNSNNRNRVRPTPQQRNRPNQRRNQAQNNNQTLDTGFQLPSGASFFEGNDQELNFLSTVSFLSDFPGQVAVKYYVVQGEMDEDGQLSIDEPQSSDLGATNELEGSLYLAIEERNLFLIDTTEMDPTMELDLEEETDEDDDEDGTEDALADMNVTAEAEATHDMVIMGPLREFTIRYRRPANRRADEADDQEDWAEVWNMEEAGGYPSAVEFTLFYETPGITDDLETEELPGIRMVIPLYDSQNLRREGRDAPF